MRPTTAGPVWMPMPMRNGSGRSAASDTLSVATLRTISPAAARAWRHPSSGPTSSPNNAITPSPVYWLATPPERWMAPPTASKYRLRKKTTSYGSRCSASRVKRRRSAKTTTTSCSRPPWESPGGRPSAAVAVAGNSGVTPRSAVGRSWQARRTSCGMPRRRSTRLSVSSGGGWGRAVWIRTRHVEQRPVADEPALADPHERRRLRRRERRASVPEHLRPHGRIAGERGGLASAVDEAENGQHRHQHHDAQQPGRRARIPRAQLDDRVQADHRVHPRQAHDQHLPAAEVGRERPERQRHARVRVLDTVDLPRDPRADDVGDEQRRDRQPEHELRGLPERHAQRAALVERPEGERHVRDQRAVEQQRDERIAPQREEVDAAGLHRVEGDEAQRMIRQVRRHIREQYEAGPEPDAPCRGHYKRS